MNKMMRVGVYSVAGVVALLLVGPKLIGLAVQGVEQEQGETALRFEEGKTDFTHQSDFVAGLPFMGLSAIDMNADGVDEIFVGGGIGQADALLAYQDGALVTVSSADWFSKATDDPTYGAASMDVTADGQVDLFVVRDSGLYLYTNLGEGFSGEKIDFPLDPKSMPLSVALGDINQDGAVDLFLSNYIRPEFVEGETIFNQQYGGISNLLVNNGDNTFTDITQSSGVYEQHNTFNASFVDMDNNGHSDLVIAQDTGFIRIYKNNGDLTFDRVDFSQDYSYPMGIAISDYNNDGLMDFYFSNVGNTLPDMMVRGDLRDDQALNKDYILLENKGDFVFEDVAEKRNANNFGFGWGTVGFDFNNDTLSDYLITQNYIRFPGIDLLELYPGRLLQQNVDGQFYPVESVAGIENQKFSVNSVVSDFNQDGWPDVVFGNLSSELRLFINQGGDNNWFSVSLKDEPASIGALVTLTLPDETRYQQQFFTSEGLGSDQTSRLFFGLGTNDTISHVSVKYQNGEVKTLENPSVNNHIDISGL